MITFRQLEIFAGIVARGSFGRCAEHLSISPEAVSANVRALETQLGYQLFDRHAGGSATLTSLGERAFEHASRILDELTYLYDPSDRTGPHRILLGAHPYIMRYLQGGIDAFRHEHPDVTIDLDIDGGTILDFPQKVARRMTDLAYYFALDDDDPTAVAATVAQEPLAIFVACDHPLAGKVGVTAADLASLPAVHLTHRTSLRPLIDRVLTAYGLGGSPVAVETDDYGLVLTSVRRGLGYVCMFASTEDEVTRANAIATLAMDRPLPSLQIRRVARSLHRGALVTMLEGRLRQTFLSSAE